MSSIPAKTFDEFMAAYDPDGTRTLTTIEPERDKDGNSPFVVVRHGQFTAVLALLTFGDHLCIDVHPFVSGQDATAAAFAMSNGRQVRFPAVLGMTSHGWPSGHLVAVLVGEQGTE